MSESLAASLVTALVLAAGAFPLLLWVRGRRGPAAARPAVTLVAALLAGGWAALAVQLPPRVPDQVVRAAAAAAAAWAVGLAAVWRLPRVLAAAGRPAPAAEGERLGLLEAALAVSADGLLVAAPDGPDAPGLRIEYANPAFERLTGHAADDAVGQSPSMLCGPDDGDEPDVLAAVRDAFRLTGPARVEVPVRRADGSRGWSEWNVVPVRVGDGPEYRVAVVRDTTRRRKAEETARAVNTELGRRVEELEALIELTPVGIAVANDPNGRAVEVNRVLRDMLGLPPAPDPELTPAPERLRVRARRDGKDIDPDDQPIYRCLRTGEPVDGVELRISLPGGGERVVVNSARPLFDDAGRVRGCVSVYTDITDRIRAEAALRESEARFRRVFEDSPLGLYRADPAGRVVMANPAALRMVGGLAVGGPARDGWVPPAGEAEARADAPAGSELSWQTPDGATVWVREHVRAIRGPGGEVVYYEGTLEDVTARRRAEDQVREREALLRNVIDHIPCGVFWKDRDSVLLGCNAQFARDHGFPDPADVVGLTDHDLPYAPAEADHHVACDQQVVQTGQPLLNLEETRTRPDGGRADRLVSKVPLVGPGGAVTGVLGVYQDITEMKRLEEQFRQAQKMDAVGRLAGGIAHDFNNLLTVINGNADLLQTLAPGDPDAAGLLADIAGAGDRAAGLVRQLLTFSRRQPVRPEVLDLNEAVAGLAGFLRRLLGERVKVATRPAAGPARVRIDRGQLEQVLVNLAVNARDAMPDGGTLALAVAPDPAGRRVRLEVSDTGAGMTDEVRARAFEPFFTTKGPDRGTGLGLAVVHGIVQQAGGRVGVESAPGAGTTFRVELPWCDADPATRAPAGPAREAAAPRGADGRPPLVLLVEDEPGVRKYARLALEGQGYEVAEAGDGEAALAWLRRGGVPDLLVSDLRMPGLDGRELARRVRAAHPGVGVVLVSGEPPEDVLAGIPRGVFVPKPFQPADLYRAARKALAARAADPAERTPAPVG